METFFLKELLQSSPDLVLLILGVAVILNTRKLSDVTKMLNRIHTEVEIMKAKERN